MMLHDRELRYVYRLLDILLQLETRITGTIFVGTLVK
jgi:hypothetical protein